MKKCKFKKDGYAESLCETMQAVATTHKTKREKGIFRRCMTNIETNKKLGEMVSGHTPNAINGVVFNYCPFCGEPLRDLERG